MNSLNRFDLGDAIRNWRAGLAQSPALRSENLDELETHLRDSIATLQTRGLCPDEAFLIATKRIGQDRSLVPEFAKINGSALWLDRALWMMIGLQVWAIVSPLLSFIARDGFAWGMVALNYDFHAQNQVFSSILFGTVQLLGFAGGLMLVWWLILYKSKSFTTLGISVLSRSTTLGLAVVGITAVYVLQWGLSVAAQMLLVKQLSAEGFAALNITRAYSQGGAMLIQEAALIAITLLLARKRLRLSRA